MSRIRTKFSGHRGLGSSNSIRLPWGAGFIVHLRASGLKTSLVPGDAGSAEAVANLQAGLRHVATGLAQEFPVTAFITGANQIDLIFRGSEGNGPAFMGGDINKIITTLASAATFGLVQVARTAPEFVKACSLRAVQVGENPSRVEYLPALFSASITQVTNATQMASFLRERSHEHSSNYLNAAAQWVLDMLFDFNTPEADMLHTSATALLAENNDRKKLETAFLLNADAVGFAQALSARLNAPESEEFPALSEGEAAKMANVAACMAALDFISCRYGIGLKIPMLLALSDTEREELKTKIPEGEDTPFECVRSRILTIPPFIFPDEILNLEDVLVEGDEPVYSGYAQDQTDELLSMMTQEVQDSMMEDFEVNGILPFSKVYPATGMRSLPAVDTPPTPQGDNLAELLSALAAMQQESTTPDGSESVVNLAETLACGNANVVSLDFVEGSAGVAMIQDEGESSTHGYPATETPAQSTNVRNDAFTLTPVDTGTSDSNGVAPA